MDLSRSIQDQVPRDASGNASDEPDTPENGHEHTKYAGSKVSIRERLSHFTWSWFECTMSTGAMASLLSQQAFPFSGVKTIGKVFFILDLVLFVLFTGLITFRFIMHPRALNDSLHHPHESFFFGTFWVSIALILYNIQQYGTPSAGTWLVKALEVLFWTYAACAMLVAIFQYHVIMDREQLHTHHAMPAWILPAYTSNTLVALAYQAPKIIPQDFLNITTIPVADVWKAVGVPCGIFVWLLGFWFCALSTVSVLSGARKMDFTLQWWGFIFPNAGLTIAAIYIGNVLESDGIKGVTSAMTILLVIVWLWVSIMTVRAIWQRTVLFPGMDEDMEDTEGHRQNEKAS